MKRFLVLLVPLLLGMSNNLSNQNVATVAIATPAGSVGAWYDVVSSGSTTNTAAVDPAYILWNDKTLPTGTATKMRIEIAGFSSPFSLKLGLYNNSNVKLQEVEVSITGNGITEGNITSQATTSGNYKLAFIPSNSGGSFTYAATGGTRYYQDAGSYALPSTLTGTSLDSVRYMVGVFIE